MSDFATALGRIKEHGSGLVEDAATMLRELVRDTCNAIHAAEGSILVPSMDQTELKFLVSINPALDPSDIRVPVGESVSGYVFSSRQAMAKVRPESEGVSTVDDVAQIETKFLLAVPIVDDDQVYGVATFVNRKGEFADTPFTPEDLMTAQAFGEIYATGMKLYRKVEFSTSITRIEIAEHAREFDVEGTDDLEMSEEEIDRFCLPDVISAKATYLPGKEREMLNRMADLLGEYAELNDDGDYDL